MPWPLTGLYFSRLADDEATIVMQPLRLGRAQRGPPGSSGTTTDAWRCQRVTTTERFRRAGFTARMKSVYMAYVRIAMAADISRDSIA